MWNDSIAMSAQNSAHALAARLALLTPQDVDYVDGVDEHPMFLAPRVMRRPSRTASLESSLDSPGITMEALMAEDELYIERKMSQCRMMSRRKHELSPLIMSPLGLLQASPELSKKASPKIFQTSPELKKKGSPEILQMSPGPPILLFIF